MSPADQPQAIDRRSIDPPTLWLSLALGSVLIHLLFFILISVVLTRTAKVELDAEPIAVEFVDPKTDAVQARSAIPKQAIAARPGQPSTSTPSTTQAQTDIPRSQPFDANQPVEQPFIPPQTVKRNRLRPRPQQPTLPASPIQPSSNIPDRLRPAVQQPKTPTSPIQPPSNAPGNSSAQQPALGDKITQLPQGENVGVTVSNPHQTADFQKQPARPIELQRNVSIRYPSTLAGQTIRLQASLYIGQDGSMQQVLEAKLLSSGGAIDQGTLIDIARQIFDQWQFVPAQDAQTGKPLTPSPSNLLIDAQVQLP